MLARAARLVPFALSLFLLTPAARAQFPGGADTGDADFSRYVALGDSLTAGFMSGGLVADVQLHSYPAHILAQATGAPRRALLQPTVSAPGIPPLMQLVSLRPVVIAPAAGFGAPTNLDLPVPYQNLAVPGARIADLLETVGDGGGLHDLILRGAGTQLEQGVAQRPTFASLWIGNNDVLAAATTGVVIEGVTLTSAAAFESKLRIAVGALRAAGADLVMANLPDVTSIPFVTTVPPVVVDPTTNRPVLVGGAPVPLIGPGGRALVPGLDFVLLTASAELAAGRGVPAALGGSGEPLSNQVVLSGDEVAVIAERVTSFNRIIRAVAEDSGAAFVNVNSIFRNAVADGISLGGIVFTPAFLTGGLFSFDGVHPTPLGYAIVANAFIRAINETYGANIPQVGLGPYVFGPFAGAGTGLPVGASAASLAGMKMSRAAEDNLRFALGLPSRQEVHRLLLAARGGDGDGDGDGDSDGGCPVPRGHGKYCDLCGPCNAGEGDCDLRPGQCADGLVCAQNVGAAYGLHPKIDVCQ